MRTLTLGSLFDGIGGFPLAAQRCGIKTLWASEIDPNCVEITKRHFPRVEHLGDITKINGGKIPPVDIISFGSPCQDLSSAGLQKGIDGERSGLFRDAIRIIYEMREATNGKYPTFIIWENVNGAFGSNGGNDFRTVLEEITNSRISMPTSGRWATAGMARGSRGGANIAWRQLDSQYWGVPQRRKRIFLVGDFRANRAPEILFECESLLGYAPKGGKEREKVAFAIVNSLETASGIAEGATTIDFGRTADRIYLNADTARAITATDGGGGSATGLYLLRDGEPITHPINLQVATRHNKLGEGTGLGIADAGQPAYTLQAAHSHGIFAVYPINDGSIHGNANGLGFGEEGREAPTLTASDRHSVAFFEAYQHSGYREADIAAALTKGQQGLRGDTPLVVECYAPSGHGGYTEGVGTLRASAGKHGRSSSNILLQIYENHSHGGFREGCGTLRANGGDYGGGSENIMIIFEKIALYVRYVLRKLMPLECERLQGFPDHWTRYTSTGARIADTPRYTALGNSLAVPCAERVFRGIVAVLSRQAA